VLQEGSVTTTPYSPNLSPCDYQIFKTEATSMWETVFKHRGLLTAV